MARSYRHIKQYEKELIELKEKGMTVKEIGEKFGLTYEQTHGFFKRQNRKKQKIAVGEGLKKKGSPLLLFIKMFIVHLLAQLYIYSIHSCFNVVTMILKE